MTSFTALNFTNPFIDSLPADPLKNNESRFVENAAYSFVEPTLTAAPTIVAITADLAQLLHINISGLATHDANEISVQHIAKVLTGNELIDGMKPYAMCYGGHQFGHWAGQLGDGRAINLGQVALKSSEIKISPEIRYNPELARVTQPATMTLQLKGAGRTPYSRRADGLAVLRSSIREFLCSEAMFHLGVPTTRALSLSLTGDLVTRDMFYDGHTKQELGAVVCRVSPSFLRFGSFQLPTKRGDLALLTQLAHYTIEHDFPHLFQQAKSDLAARGVDVSETKNIFTPPLYIKWFSEVCDRTCEMVVHWMRVGFVHGVMNTDNMSIIGETIDYGPYGWTDDFNLHWTPNTTDKEGLRYRFGNQAKMCQWNLFQLANAIFPLINDAGPLEALLNKFSADYQHQWQTMMAEKTGLTVSDDGQVAFFDRLEALLSEVETDMTIFYRLLATTPLSAIDSFEQVILSHEDESVVVTLNDDDIQRLMAHFSDCFYQLEQHPADYEDKFSEWFTDYLNHLAKDIRQDVNQPQSHESLVTLLYKRTDKMNQVNPKYVLRNYLAQQAIELAEKGDYSELKQLQQLLTAPYNEQSEFERFAKKRPEWARTKAGCSMLSCSS